MSCRRGRHASQLGRRRGLGTPGDILGSLLLVHLCFTTVLQALDTGSTSEIIDNDKKLHVQDLTKTPMNICLKPLEGRPIIEAMLRLEVKPIGPGSDKLHVAGGVAVPSSLLQPESGWSLLRYEYSTTLEKQVTLKAWLNDVELPYEPFTNKYSGRYSFHAVKFYMQGRVELIFGCTQPPITTTSTTSTTERPTTSSVKTLRSPRPSKTTTPATTNKPPALSSYDATTKNNIGASPNTSAESTTPISDPIVQSSTSGIWMMGAAGPVPILIIVVVAVVLIVAIAGVILLCLRKGRKKRGSTTRYSSEKTTDPFKKNYDPLLKQHRQNGTERDDLEKSRILINPAYKPVANTGEPPNYYSGN